MANCISSIRLTMPSWSTGDCPVGLRVFRGKHPVSHDFAKRGAHEPLKSGDSRPC